MQATKPNRNQRQRAYNVNTWGKSCLLQTRTDNCKQSYGGEDSSSQPHIHAKGTNISTDQGGNAQDTVTEMSELT